MPNDLGRTFRGAAVGVAICCAALGAAQGSEPHLPFFQENRDFLLRAWEKLPQAVPAPADSSRRWSFDPFADASARARLSAVRSSLDSAATLEDLGAFRAALDSLLGDTQRAAARLDGLDASFAAHLRTALEVTLATKPGLDVERVEAWLDGTLVQQHTLSDAERSALDAGGILEVCRRVVEPRAQQLEVRAWTRGHAECSRTPALVDPTPDLLTICHLDLDSALGPARVARAALGGRK
jgi:hypothetical protein